MEYEITDTFGGEANYSWTRHGILTAKTKRGQIREIKALMGITGRRARVSDWGDMIRIDPVGRDAPCVVAFLSWQVVP